MAQQPVSALSSSDKILEPDEEARIDVKVFADNNKLVNKKEL